MRAPRNGREAIALPQEIVRPSAHLNAIELRATAVPNGHAIRVRTIEVEAVTPEAIAEAVCHEEEVAAASVVVVVVVFEVAVAGANGGIGRVQRQRRSPRTRGAQIQDGTGNAWSLRFARFYLRKPGHRGVGRRSLTQRRKGAKKILSNAAALCGFAPLRERSSR